MLIFMPRFKSINFIKIGLKLGHFCKKFQNLRTLRAPPSDTLKHPRNADLWLRAWLLLFMGDKSINE